MGKGAYGEVTLHTSTQNEKHAIKIMGYVIDDEISQTSVRELAILKRMNHPNILKLVDYDISDDLKKLYIVTDLMENGELTNYIAIIPDSKRNEISKRLTYQLLLGVAYMHSLDIIHRDLKPPNLLLDADLTLKIADFGLARALTCISPDAKTLEVVTIWYRPPELLYGGRADQYNLSLDMWSVGCIIYEILTEDVLFKAFNPADMRDEISSYLGFPTEISWPGVTKFPAYDPNEELFGFEGEPYEIKIVIAEKIKNKADVETWYQLIMSLLKYDPAKRATAIQTFKNPIFDTVRDEKLEATHHSCLDNLYMVEKPINFSIEEQKDINVKMKYIIMNWLLGVTIKYRFLKRTYYIALYLHDSLKMSDLFKSRGDYQLYATACLYLAMTYGEVHPASVNDFVYMAGKAYTGQQILDMSTNILKQIEFKMVFSTCYDFNVEYGTFYDTRVEKLSRGLLYFLSLLPDKLYQTKPDQVALMSIMMACMYYEKKFKHYSLISNDLIKNIKFCLDLTLGNEFKTAEAMFKSAKYKYAPEPGMSVNEVVKILCSKKLIH